MAFAAEGAEVVVSDIDEVGLKSTVTTIAGRGGVAHSYLVDVADADAVEQFADRVCAEHGVPDIVVNNAGIGVAGAFLDTPAEQFDRVLEVNLGEWSTAADPSPADWCTAAPADTSSTSPRWPRTRR